MLPEDTRPFVTALDFAADAGPLQTFNEESAPLKAMLDAAKAILDSENRESRYSLEIIEAETP